MCAVGHLQGGHQQGIRVDVSACIICSEWTMCHVVVNGCMFINRAKKLLNLRLFENPDNGKAWDKSVKDLDLEVLCVSQVSVVMI